MVNQILLCIFLFVYVHGSAEDAIYQTMTVHSLPRIDFFPKELNAVIEEEIKHVSFGISWENSTDQVLIKSLQDSRGDYHVSMISEDANILEIVNFSYPQCIQAEHEPKNFSFTVKGIFLGYTKLRVSLREAVKGCEAFKGNGTLSSPLEQTRDFELPASVIRPPSFLAKIVTSSVTALVAFNFINMGVELDMKCIAKVLKKPIGPAIGYVCQFLFMPLASFGIGMLLLDDNSLRLGLFILGCSPGGSMSNFWTLLFDGDVNLSVTMTFISTIAAMAMMPLWIFTLGAPLFRNSEATIPYINLVGSLLLLTFPVGIGLLIQQYSPRLSKISQKIFKPLTLICVFVSIGVGLYANTFIFKLFTWQMVLAGISIAWGGYCFGAFIAWLFRLEKSQIIAVSIETAFQNPAVAYVTLLLSLPQPEADLASVPLAVQLLLTGLPMWVLLILTRVYKKMKVCCEEDGIVEKPETDTVHKVYLAVNTNPPENGETVALEPRSTKVSTVRLSS
ncbi:unnamed protein product [Larinioides sclopetarius]|uniref:P3 protein n=1 Tax=Larinioides sclopetarius TaxID=280406 RepID=A0AAV1ZQZ9_9ARAC